MNTVILKYQTDRGFDWLEEEVTFKDEDYKYVFDQYVLKNKSMARSLLTKWENDGEQVTFYMDIVPIDCDNDVFIKMEKYLNELEDLGQTM